ncbi:sensor histidine kinase [Spartinivicinus poritis]|uniref:histidine kinase n=1 Tax=Spartinivicinus poritis TaxID=2994640 RepID=A0ABT5UDI5_9GAMM|nr:sensor histidine kinase [Spartinivicinus sp. A2-2]MDE1463154.1 ATP-binding protein [Spartinivicinus sp. A2-2]
MNFELGHLFIISAGYLALLFIIAYCAEKGVIKRTLVSHPVTYVLSLGVYASAWAFYGTTGLVHQYGFLFLAYFLGICGAYLLAPVLLAPILKLTRTYQLGSLADLFAFRFRSSWAGTLTTGFMLLAMLPLIALQIQAVADSADILSQHGQPEELALGFCGLITLFTVLFGTRHISSRDRHTGLVMAIAFDSVIKLIAMGVAGIFALWFVFNGPGDLDQWLASNAEALTALHTPLQEGPWRTLLLIFFAAAMVMPHMFHMGFIENPSPKALYTASWGLPLYLLLFSLAIPPILWAGLKLNNPTTPEYFILGASLTSESPLLVGLIFIGGLSAASGVTIVATLALSGMLLNHVVLLSYQPSSKVDIYKWLLWTRRLLTLLIITASYGFYWLLGAKQDLSNLGIAAFVGTLQFLPGILSVLYWPAANRQGFITGLIVGAIVWFLTLMLPLFFDIEFITFPIINLTLPLDENSWHIATIASLSANTLTFVLVSLLTPISEEEVGAANACSVDNVSRPHRWMLAAQSPAEFQEQLGKILGSRAAQREVSQALQDLNLAMDESRPYALRRLRDRIEANLSGLMGPAVAKDIVDSFLPYKLQADVYVTEDINFIEGRFEAYQSQLTGLAAELNNLRRFHRHTLENLPLGVCSIGKDSEVLMWNRAMAAITGIGSSKVVGSRFEDIPEPWKSLFNRFATNPARNHLSKEKIIVDGEPRWLSLHKAAIGAPFTDDEGLVILLDDATDTQLLENKLVHTERLASIGQLAAGVAHEIGNPVTGIACLAQELKSESQEDSTKQFAEQILEQTQRITRIVQTLVSFAHQGSQHQPTNQYTRVVIKPLIEKAIQLLQLADKQKQLVFLNECSDSAAVMGDEQRLMQVFINLLRNASDASPAKSQIKVTTVACGSLLKVAVADQGCGIPKPIQNKLFEPFFTTKDPGKGTGLGLALVYNIIEDHSGQISIESPLDLKQNSGTKVTVSLPLVTA